MVRRTALKEEEEEEEEMNNCGNLFASDLTTATPGKMLLRIFVRRDKHSPWVEKMELTPGGCYFYVCTDSISDGQTLFHKV